MKYPFPKTTQAERKMLDQIGAGNATLAGIFSRNIRTNIERFIAEGWIKQCGEKEICNDRFGRVAVPEYEMDTSWHMEWCKYQAERHEQARTKGSDHE